MTVPPLGGPPPDGAAAGWMGAFLYCPLCDTAIPPGYVRCPACNFLVVPRAPRPSRDTVLRLAAYCVALWVLALLLVLALR